MGKRARARRRRGEVVAGREPTATVIDEAERTIAAGVERIAGVELHPRQRELLEVGRADGHDYDLPDDERLEPHAPVRDRREAEQRLRELAMRHVELPTDEREQRIARERRAEQLGAAVKRLLKTPTTAPDRAAAVANYRKRIGEVLSDARK